MDILTCERCGRWIAPGCEIVVSAMPCEGSGEMTVCWICAQQWCPCSSKGRLYCPLEEDYEVKGRCGITALKNTRRAPGIKRRIAGSHTAID